MNTKQLGTLAVFSASFAPVIIYLRDAKQFAPLVGLKAFDGGLLGMFFLLFVFYWIGSYAIGQRLYRHKLSADWIIKSAVALSIFDLIAWAILDEGDRTRLAVFIQSGGQSAWMFLLNLAYFGGAFLDSYVVNKKNKSEMIQPQQEP